MNLEQKKMEILESCSEDAWGSWEFWSVADGGKTESGAKLIVQAIQELIKEKLIVPTDGRYVKDGTYKKITLDVVRLTREVMLSIPYTAIDPDTFYWFYATRKGEKAYQAWAKEYWTEERVAKEKEKWKKKSKR